MNEHGGFGDKVGAVLKQREAAKDYTLNEIEELRGLADHLESNIEDLASRKAWLGDMRFGGEFASNQRRWLEGDIDALRKHAEYLEKNLEQVTRVRTALSFSRFGDRRRLKALFGEDLIKRFK